MNDENKSSENTNINKSEAEPRFKVGDIVWAPMRGHSGGNPLFFQTAVLGVAYMRKDSENEFFGYVLGSNEHDEAMSPECVFATRQECESYIDAKLVSFAKADFAAKHCGA